LGQIALRYSLNVEDLMEANHLTNPNWLDIGQELIIPVPTPGSPGPAFKIIPDSELVYGPVSAYFDLDGYIQEAGGYLSQYTEVVDSEELTGAEIVARIAREYSVNPRLLLAVLEHQSLWVTSPSPDPANRDFPLGWYDPNKAGLFRQLAWAANELNRGYYMWRVNGVASWVLADGRVVPIDSTINAGTAGVQNLFAKLLDRDSWEAAVTASGVFATYLRLFGYPFDLAIEPLIPPDLTQPPMQLPFEPGVAWAFTGGPHGGWDDGSAWAALDFAPRGELLGCTPGAEWVVAVADGLIVRTDLGEVVQDLDNDGLEQTGWTVLYLHIASEDRVSPGTFLKAGERIGHPSCEGGYANATHLHLARRYNGEWIPADQNLPFNLDRWVSSGTGTAYDGYLQRGDQILEACECRSPENTIQR
jgi:murein DD-endopeptidase MepM/ murein hydrolase activator NlpD